MSVPAISRRTAIAAALVCSATPLWARSVRTAQDANGAVDAALAAMPDYQADASVAGVISLWGHGSYKHDFMGKLIGRWIAEFNQFQPEVRFDYRMYGTASAIGSLYTGAGSLAILGEEISPAAARAFARERGYQATGYSIATGNVDINFFDYAHMIFVHRSNPLRALSLPQLAAIFGAEPQQGRPLIRQWGALGIGGSLSQATIQPYGWETDEDFGLFFRERVLADSHRWNPVIKEFGHAKRPDGTQYDHGQRILDALANDPNGIAISNVRYANPSVRVLDLAWNEGDAPVAATPETLISQQYPLTRTIPAYIDRVPGEPVDPPLREFLRFILSRSGQSALVEESGYLPVGPEIAKRERERLV
jgi:phosphate transport system substrate-binding protein